MQNNRVATRSLITLVLLVLIAPTSAVADENGDEEEAEERYFNHDSLLAGATVHSFAGDVGGIDPFFGYGVKWDTFSDFQGIEELEGETIWEFIALGLEVYFFQGLTSYQAEFERNDQTLEFDSSALQAGILATMMYLPGRLHPYIGVGFAWTELSAEDDDKLPGSAVFPMLDFNLGSRLDLTETFFLDLSLYGNWGRDGAIGVEETQDIFFFSTFLGLGVNVI